MTLQSIGYPPTKTCFTNIHPLQFITPKLQMSVGLTPLFIRPPTIRVGRVYLNEYFISLKNYPKKYELVGTENW